MQEKVGVKLQTSTSKKTNWYSTWTHEIS